MITAPLPGGLELEEAEEDALVLAAAELVTDPMTLRLDRAVRAVALLRPLSVERMLLLRKSPDEDVEQRLWLPIG